MSLITASTTFQGYRRDNGRVGVRNPSSCCPWTTSPTRRPRPSPTTSRARWPCPIPGRLQFGEDLELHFRTLIGTGCNPNVAAVVVIGIEEGWTRRVVDGIAATGKPVAGFSIELHGDHDTIMRASRQPGICALRDLAVAQRVPHRRSVVSTKCGESDTTSGCGANPTVGNAFDKLYALGSTLVFGETSELTGGEHIVAERCANDAVRERFMFMFNRYQAAIDRWKTSDLSESQPTRATSPAA